MDVQDTLTDPEKATEALADGKFQEKSIADESSDEDDKFQDAEEFVDEFKNEEDEERTSQKTRKDLGNVKTHDEDLYYGKDPVKEYKQGTSKDTLAALKRTDDDSSIYNSLSKEFGVRNNVVQKIIEEYERRTKSDTVVRQESETDSTVKGKEDSRLDGKASANEAKQGTSKDTINKIEHQSPIDKRQDNKFHEEDHAVQKLIDKFEKKLKDMDCDSIDTDVDKTKDTSVSTDKAKPIQRVYGKDHVEESKQETSKDDSTAFQETEKDSDIDQRVADAIDLKSHVAQKLFDEYERKRRKKRGKVFVQGTETDSTEGEKQDEKVGEKIYIYESKQRTSKDDVATLQDTEQYSPIRKDYNLEQESYIAGKYDDGIRNLETSKDKVIIPKNAEAGFAIDKTLVENIDGNSLTDESEQDIIEDDKVTFEKTGKVSTSDKTLDIEFDGESRADQQLIDEPEKKSSKIATLLPHAIISDSVTSKMQDVMSELKESRKEIQPIEIKLSRQGNEKEAYSVVSTESKLKESRKEILPVEIQLSRQDNGKEAHSIASTESKLRPLTNSDWLPEHYRSNRTIITEPEKESNNYLKTMHVDLGPSSAVAESSDYSSADISSVKEESFNSFRKTASPMATLKTSKPSVSGVTSISVSTRMNSSETKTVRDLRKGREKVEIYIDGTKRAEMDEDHCRTFSVDVVADPRSIPSRYMATTSVIDVNGSKIKTTRSLEEGTETIEVYKDDDLLCNLSTS